MKKLLGLVVLFGAVVLLTGCGGGKTYTCTAKVTENGVTYTGKIIASLDGDDKVKGYDIEMIFEDEDAAKQTYAVYEWVNSYAQSEEDKINAKLSGKKITIKDADKLDSGDEDEVSYVGLTKEEFKKAAEQNSEGAEFKCE